ncbi:MAG: transglutaminase family protein [Leptospiraceae bacterium]|nr:transglutaminase family protein [Leptospiraceae bacterium]
MSLFGNSFGHYKPQKKLEQLLYELEFSDDSNKESIIKSIGSVVPWEIPISEVIDELTNSSLRLTARNHSREIQIEMVNYHLGLIAFKGQTNHYRDLEKAVFLLSIMGDPFANYQVFKSELDRLSYRVGELFELNRVILTDDVKVHLLSRVLHQEEGFNGNQIFYHNPENSYVSKVIHSKFGIPISLSVIYILIGLRQNLPLFGVNLPMHFMVSFETNDYSTFIDPFNGGVLVDKETCLKFLEANGYKESPEFFSKASTLSILRRMYNNLLIIYKKIGDRKMEDALSKQLFILEENPAKKDLFS